MTPEEQTISEILYDRDEEDRIRLLSLMVEKRAIAFAEWLSINGWYFNKIKRWSNRNESSDNLIKVLSSTKSTEELYTQFIESQTIQ
jgi:hypothetical protein